MTPSGSGDSGCRPWPPDHPDMLDLAEAAVFTGPLLLLSAAWWVARQIAIRTAR